MRLFVTLALIFSISTDADARRKKRTNLIKAEISIDENSDVFSASYKALSNGQKEMAINMLFEIAADESQTQNHGRAYLYAASILDEMGLSYSALFTYNDAILNARSDNRYPT